MGYGIAQSARSYNYTSVVALEEAYEVEATIPLGCHATETRQEHHQVNQSNVTSKFKQDLRMLKP